MLSSTAAMAQTATFAAETSGSTISPCPSFCGGAGGVFESTSDGGVGVLNSSVALDNTDGVLNAIASLDGAADLPSLGAEAFSYANSRASSQAFGMQGFYVTGSTYSLDITLTGSALDVPTSDVDGSAVAHVMIFRDNDPSTDFYLTSHYPTMKFEGIPGEPDLELLADALEPSGLPTLTIPADGQLHSVSTTLTVTGLAPNDLIYVWADLVASGTRSGYGDALDTLTMSFQNPTGLSHDPHPIPEPSTWLICSLAVMGLAAWRRRP
jgi:hypothetical protein